MEGNEREIRLGFSEMLGEMLSGYPSGVPRGGFGGLNPPPPKFRRPSKIVPNSTPLWKLLKIAEFRMPTHQDVPKKGSKILKLPPVRNCFTLALTNKLVVIINSLKVPKIKKILLYEMKFLVPNYSCLQNPLLGGYCPQIPVLSVLCPQLNLLNPPPPNKIPWHAPVLSWWRTTLSQSERILKARWFYYRRRFQENWRKYFKYRWCHSAISVRRDSGVWKWRTSGI